MRVLGMISGTSLDGIDAAAVEFTAEGNGHLALDVVAADTLPYEPSLRAALVAALPPAASSADDWCRLDTGVGQAFAAVAEHMRDLVGGVDAVCSHGQTVYHWVADGRALGTLQIGQPAWIAERLGVPVVSDLRSRDLVAGGQGAPLVSLLDQWVLAGRGRPVAALNLGGISNMTVVRPGADALAYDIGPANGLIDAVVRSRGLRDCGYDEGGEIARSGSVSEELLDVMLQEPYYGQPAPKSTGKELFHTGYLDGFPIAAELSSADLVATLTELTVRTVVADVRAAGVDELYVSGGGASNPVMLSGIVDGLADLRVGTTDDLGLPADAKEAIAFALMGWCTLHGLPGNVPSATGARAHRILGSITPGAGPLVLPPPAEPVVSLTCQVRRP